MHQIITFFLKNKTLLLFLLLEFIAFSLTIQSHSFHRSKLINSSNAFTGFIYHKFNLFSKYSDLRTFNTQLETENNKLKNLLNNKSNTLNTSAFSVIDSIVYNQKYNYINAIITNNVYTKSNNRFTINKGKNDLVVSDLGVVNSKGILGIVTNTSAHYATVMSILNENTKINARLKKDLHFGTIVWNGKDYKTVQFEDLPRQANIKVGDTIITDGKSTIFPEGILIGKIVNFKLANNNYETINVTLFNDMSAIKHVNIVANLDKIEILNLEQSNE